MQALFWLLVVLQSCTLHVKTASYSKVAKWGATQLTTDETEGRSNGQSLFTQRSDVSLRSGQNLNTKPKENVVYQYSRPASMQKPVKVQGFQDRFNPPPIFQFGNSKHNDDDHDPTLVFSESKKTLYDSPISSYNPAPAGIPSNVPKFQTEGPIYPPFVPTQAPTMNEIKDAPMNDNPNDNGGENSNANPDNNDNDYGDNDNDKPDSGYQYNPPVPSVPRPNVPKLQDNGPIFSAFMPSQSQPVDDNPPMSETSNDNENDNLKDYDTDPPDEKPHHGYHYHPPVPSISFTSPSPKPYLEKPKHHFKFPAYVYDTNASDVILDHPPTYPKHHDHHEHHDYPTIDSFKTSDLANFPAYLDHHPSFAKIVDHYPTDNFHFEEPHDHYIHKVIHTTTTTTPPPPPPPAKEEKRVNKGHYSYYYLGRKLYYIPLYFSVYFIIYITVLILKSIARHKVTFAYDLRDVAQGRSLSSSSNENLDEVQEQTTQAIVDFKRRFIAM